MLSSLKLKEVKIEITHNCALKCIHCSSVADDKIFQQVNWDDCKRILDQSWEMGVTEIAFSGGEPLLWVNLPKAIEYAKYLGFHVTVYSTGYIKDIDTVLFRLGKSSLDRIIFSLYAGSESIHEKITGVKGSFDHTLKAIKIAAHCIKNVELHFVPMKMNFMELPKVVKLADDLGISKISVLRLVPQGRGSSDDLALTKEDTITLRGLVTTLRACGANIRLGSPYSIMCFSDSPHCAAAINKMTISPSLSIAPCDAFKQITSGLMHLEDEFENLNVCSLKDAWEQSKYFNAVREYISSPPGQECGSCNAFDRCHSGCVAQKVHLLGELAKIPDPLCLKQSQPQAM